MRAACIDRLANVVFSLCCVALLGVAAVRSWRPVSVHAAREDVLDDGAPDPFVAATGVTGRSIVYVFVSTDCRPCRDSLGFYRTLAAAASASSSRAGLLFVGMEPESRLSSYLREGGVADARVASVLRPAQIPGTPSVVAGDASHLVRGSWAGRLNAAQEHDVLAFVQRGTMATGTAPPNITPSEWLARARATLNAGRPVDAVVGIEVSGTDTAIRDNGDRATPYMFTLFWPDHLQLQIGPAVHLLDGDAYSRRVADPDRFGGPILERMLQDPESIKTAASGMHWHLLRLLLTYLVRTPAGVTVEDEGTRDFGQLKGQAIAVRKAGGRLEAELVLEPTSAQPLGMVSDVRLVGGSKGASEATSISLFGDYRDVSGVRLPYRLDEWTGDTHSRFVATSIKVTTK